MNPRDNPPRSTVSPGALPCSQCGYDLRGCSDSMCPECGQHAELAIASYRQSHEVLSAVNQLDGAGIGFRTISTRTTLSTAHAVWLGQSDEVTAIVVALADRERAREALAEIAPTLPIVDHDEPFCPSCNAAVDASGPGRCAACGTSFEWFDIEPIEADREGLTCSTCQYDLTQSAGDRCPECGSLIGPMLVDRTVAAAAGYEPHSAANAESERAMSGRPGQRATRKRSFLAVFWTSLVVGLVCVVTMMATVSDEVPVEWIALTFVAAAIGVVLWFLPQKQP